MTLIRRSFKICFLWPDLARSPGSSLSECVRQTGPWGTSSYWWLEQLEKITKQWNINKDLLLKALVIAFKTRIYKNASIFVWRVYPSFRLETCQSLNLLTLVWGNKNNRQIKEAKCHRQKFKSFCSSFFLSVQVRNRFVNISLNLWRTIWNFLYWREDILLVMWGWANLECVQCTAQWLIDTDTVPYVVVCVMLLCLSSGLRRRGLSRRGARVRHVSSENWWITDHCLLSSH